MKHWLALFALSFLLSSCDAFDYNDVEFVSMGAIQLEEIRPSQVTLGVNLELLNPNWYNITLQPSILDLYVNDDLLGKAALLKKVKLKGKKTQFYIAHLQLKGEPGILQKLIAIQKLPTATIRFKGVAYGSVMGIKRGFAIDKTEVVDPSQFKFGQLSLR